MLALGDGTIAGQDPINRGWKNGMPWMMPPARAQSALAIQG
jgi:hypothetical protein